MYGKKMEDIHSEEEYGYRDITIRASGREGEKERDFERGRGRERDFGKENRGRERGRDEERFSLLFF